MATVDEIKIVVKAEVDAAISKMKQLDDINKKNDKSASALAATFGKELFSGFMKFAGPAGAAMLVGQGFQKLTQYLKESLVEFEAADQSARKLEGIIRATGGAAGFTADELQGFAGALSKTTGMEDDAIVELQSMMLTFKSVTGETFQRATQGALDMAAAFGTDASNAAVMLGKALESPSTGLTALRKIGVTYNAQQIETIKNLEAEGKLQEAQAIILSGLEGQVKGVAAAMNDSASGAHKNYTNAVNNLKEEQGRAVANGLKPYWQWMANINENLTAAIKFENDYAEAVKRHYAGTATATDKVTMAKMALASITAEGNDYFEEEIVLAKQSLALAERQVEMAGRLSARDKEQAEVAAKEAARLAKQKEDYAKYIAAKIKAEEDAAVAVYESWQQAKDVAEWEAAYLAKQTAEKQSAEDFLFDLMQGYNEDELAALKILDKQKDKDIEKTKEQTEVEKLLGSVATSAFQSMSEALGAAIITGEDGWKAFGKAGLNAIAAVIEGLAQIELANAVMDLAGILTAPLAAGHFAAAAGMFAAAGLVKAIPMAEGGSGIVTKPTLFLAGEAGPEPFAFGGANNKRGMGIGGITQVFNIGGSVIAENQLKSLAVAGISQASRGY